MLVTIIDAKGSSPRGKGAAMAVDESGLLAGSVGGGKVEALALQQAAECLKTQSSCVRNFVLQPYGDEAIGMACGGEVTLSFEPLAQTDAARLLAMLDALKEERVLIYGGGHVGHALAPLLRSIDFSVWVLDDRPTFALPERFPAADRVLLCDYDRLFDFADIRDGDYHVVVTDGHQHDFAVENQILRHPFAYVGVIGSRKKTKAVNDRLRDAGIPEETLAKIHAPIGLDIKAKTPAEIAVSIAAELIAERAKLREKNEASVARMDAQE